MSPISYTSNQLDALRELANIGSGTAGTALSQMLGRSVDISVPNALALPLAEAVEAVGSAEDDVTGVVIPLSGDLDAVVLLVFPTPDADTLCGMLGVEAGTEVGQSALAEIGNILGASYIGSLGMMTGLELDLTPPQAVTDMLAAIVSTVLAHRAEATDTALILDSELRVEGESCSLSFLLLPAAGGVDEILARMGVEA
ncbi:MAG: chemotaxis protein CheC [Solirubrobacteraceae bacterium]|jgi:chemotaxis protein CheC|nr:chemotaxis protein CheC [Solirubrobacteraceae bacterium]